MDIVNVFDSINIEEAMNPQRVSTRMTEDLFKMELAENTEGVVIDYSKVTRGSGVLFHGSKVLVPSLRSGFDLYNEGIGINCANVGGWCRGISLTDDIETATKFSDYNGWIYLVYLEDVKIIKVDVDDAAWLYNSIDDLRSHGIDLVVINNSREREAVLINPSAQKIKAVLSTDAVNQLIEDESFYKMIEALGGELFEVYMLLDGEEVDYDE